MLQALNQISKIRLITLMLFLAMLSIAGMVKAQVPPRSQKLRIVDYRADRDLIRGFGVPGSTIKFYYGEPGSFTPLPGSAPIEEKITDANGGWFFSPTFQNMGYFTGPVVVTMTLPGGTEEILESPILGPDEVFIRNPFSCTDTKDLSMTFGYGGVVTWRNQRGEPVWNGPSYANAPPGTYTVEYRNIDGRFYSSGPLTVEGRPVAYSQNLFLGCSETYIDHTGIFDGVGATFLWKNKADGSTYETSQRVRLREGEYEFYVTNNYGCQSEPATITVRASPVVATIISGGDPVKNADCNENNGSITGIIVQAANGQNPTYRWRDTRGNTYTDLDITGLAPDRYTLEAFTASNPCPSTLADLEVKEENGIDLNETLQIPGPTSCGLDNGSITGLIPINATEFRWYNQLQPEITRSETIDLKNAPPGFYMLDLKNNFCTKTFGPFHVAEGTPAIELTSTPVIKDDNCNLGKGSITGITFNTQVTYLWLNAAGVEMARNGDLLNAPAGNYRLAATSRDGKCTESYPYTIGNSESVIAPPVMDDILVCSASDVNVSFKEASDNYRVYDAAGALVTQSKSKDFRIRVNQPGVYYATLSSGTCESSKTMFRIDFGASGLSIPTVFSPNGDGVNDKWIIKGMDVYTTPEVRIFNRTGEVVFHTYGHSQPFDGRSKGKELPVGVYYYIVRPSPECSSASGSLTLIR